MSGRKLFLDVLNILKLLRQSQTETYYKVVDFSKESALINFQVIGKNQVFKVHAQDLLNSDFLMGFSKADAILITHLGTKAVNNKSSAKIVSQIIQKSGKTNLKLKFNYQEHFNEVDPEKILFDLETLNALSSSDAAMIGYTAAENKLHQLKKTL